MNKLISKQALYLKSPFVDMNNRYNKFFPAFVPLNKEFSPGNCLCDNFSDCFFFYPWPYNVKNQLCKLDNIIIVSSSKLSACIIILDVSIKNYIATSISHVHSFDQPIIKIYHQAINIFTTEVELFTIRCSINHVMIQDSKC